MNYELIKFVHCHQKRKNIWNVSRRNKIKCAICHLLLYINCYEDLCSVLRAWDKKRTKSAQLTMSLYNKIVSFNEMTWHLPIFISNGKIAYLPGRDKPCSHYWRLHLRVIKVKVTTKCGFLLDLKNARSKDWVQCV